MVKGEGAGTGGALFPGLSGLRPIATGKGGFGIGTPASTGFSMPATSTAAPLPPPATGWWAAASPAPASSR